MYPTGQGLLVRRLACNVKGQTTAGEAFEADAILNDVTAAVVFEHKAAWLREDKILADDHEEFLDQLREKYGVSSNGDERPKGVAQLTKIIGAITRREWKGERDEFSHLQAIYPVLTVHDERMAASGLGRFLDDEFRRLLGSTPLGVTVHPLIV